MQREFLLSRSVAAGMETCIKLKELPQCDMSTVRFFRDINDLFDMCNTSNPWEKRKLYKLPYSREPNQVAFLRNMITNLSTAKIITNGANACFKGWALIISAIISLFDHLKLNGFSYLLVRHLCQDPLEKFFAVVRFQQGCGNTVTAAAVKFTFKTFIITKFSLMSSHTNCQMDLHTIIALIKEKNRPLLPGQSNPERPILPDFDFTYSDISSNESVTLFKCVTIYYAGYSIYK